MNFGRMLRELKLSKNSHVGVIKIPSYDHISELIRLDPSINCIRDDILRINKWHFLRWKMHLEISEIIEAPFAFSKESRTANCVTLYPIGNTLSRAPSHKDLEKASILRDIKATTGLRSVFQ